MTPPVPPPYAMRERTCPFAAPQAIAALPSRETPYWWSIATSRHLGIYRPHAKVCTWTARYLSGNKLYKQKALGRALDAGQGAMGFGVALRLAEAWFTAPDVADKAHAARPAERMTGVSLNRPGLPGE